MAIRNISTVLIPSAQFWYEIRANSPARNRKERFGDWLRTLAQRIDGRRSLSIDIETLPLISDKAKSECIFAGIKSIKSNVENAVREEMIENQIKRHIPSVCGSDERDILVK